MGRNALIRQVRNLTSLLFLLLATSLVHAEDGTAMIGDGSTVVLEFTLALEDGTVIESNVGKDPLTYVQGQGQMLPGLEAALVGVAAGTERKISLAPADGFGEVNAEALQSVPLEEIPENAREVGAILTAQDPSGRQSQVRVAAVEADHVVLDLNHPLAGQNLHFDVKVLEVR